jgi:hypothetical protein
LDGRGWNIAVKRLQRNEGFVWLRGYRRDAESSAASLQPLHAETVNNMQVGDCDRVKRKSFIEVNIAAVQH